MDVLCSSSVSMGETISLIRQDIHGTRIAMLFVFFYNIAIAFEKTYSRRSFGMTILL